MSIKHAFQSAKPDGSDATKVQATAWNADHDLSGLVAADVTDFNTAASAAAPVQSVNGDTGVVVLAAADVGAAATVHSHIASDVSDFSEAVDDRVATLLVAGTNIAITYDDKANTLTVDASAPVIGSDKIGRASCRERV